MIGISRPALVLPVLLALLGCGDAPPDVVLITVDTLRADRLGAYGSTTTRTPNFDRLAREGRLFEAAVSPLPETRPSHFTLFTSSYPRDHGVVSNMLTLGEEAVTLAEVYSAAGYRTAAFVGCLLFDTDSGVHQGFDTVDVPASPQRPAGEVVPRTLEWLAAAGDGPFFLWLHLFDPHMPYEPPAPWNAPRQGASKRAARRLPKLAWPDLQKIAAQHDGNLPRWAFRRGLDLYDGEVEHVDHWLGRLFAALEERGSWENTVVVLTSDHGECFGGGVYFDHSQCLGEGALAVPLLLRAPGVARGTRVAEVVEHLDVAPTLLALSGLAAPPSFRGRNLLAKDREARDAFFQHPYYQTASIEDRRDVVRRLRSVAGRPTRPILGDRLQMGVRRGGWKYLLWADQGGDREELYDLAADPGERVDRAAGEPERTRELRHAVRRWLHAHPWEPAAAGDVDPRLLENLRALGYLGP